MSPSKLLLREAVNQGAFDTVAAESHSREPAPAKSKVLAEYPDASGEELQTLVEKESVMNSLVNLLSYPYVRSGVANKTLKIMGGYYNFVDGKFQIMEVDYDVKPTIDI
ncbi:carbonic anhydrase [Artemisia annua]|uniref:Carbonic anhydrase n=1 Tax=Artemisia annua TaxID=35608 RepID=A0A2U1Q7N6_ARTAN|nr:carbonic anhydrase [Artemisia annua]